MNHYEFYKSVKVDKDTGALLVKVNGDILDDRNDDSIIPGILINSNRLSQITTTNNILDVTLNDNNLLINLKCNDDYTITLPDISTVLLGFKVKFKNLHTDSVVGSIYPFGSDLLEGGSTFNFFGKGFFEITKMASSDGLSMEWVITHYSNIIESKYQGKSKIHYFNEAYNVVLNHELKYNPVTEVWVNVDGEHYKCEVEVVHNNLNTLTVNFGDIKSSGYILYV